MTDKCSNIGNLEGRPEIKIPGRAPAGDGKTLS